MSAYVSVQGRQRQIAVKSLPTITLVTLSVLENPYLQWANLQMASDQLWGT